MEPYIIGSIFFNSKVISVVKNMDFNTLCAIIAISSPFIIREFFKGIKSLNNSCDHLMSQEPVMYKTTTTKTEHEVSQDPDDKSDTTIMW